VTPPPVWPAVEITQDGRGGSIRYVEEAGAIPFTWEFEMPPAVALIFGPGPGRWDADFPWAAGRRAAVYAWVGEEVVRRQAPGGHAEVDLENARITIWRAPRGRA
jgi:hypothetical protein